MSVMKNYTFLLKLRSWLLSGIKVQLLTAALSLPVLVAWGLPISIMSVVGNLLATPFLMGVLMLNSLLFLTELLSLPNASLYWATEKLTLAWHYLLSFGHEGWLIGFAAPPLAISLLLGTVTAVGLWYAVHKWRCSIIWASITTMLLYLGICLLFQQRYTHTLEHIHCINRKGRQFVIDDGFFTYKTSYKSPVRYRIKPLLFRVFGTNHIQRWHSAYAGVRTLRALSVVLDEISIQEISFGSAPTKPTPSWHKAWQELQEKALQKNTQLLPLR